MFDAVFEYTQNNFSKYFFKYSQSTWYCVSETPPDFEFSSTFTWENWISVNCLYNFFTEI